MRARISVLGRITRADGVRPLTAAFAAFNLAEYGAWVAILVYAYEHGGATESALIAACQLLPAAVAAPLAARAVDQGEPACALRRGYTIQTSTYGVTAVLMFFAAPSIVVYTAAILAACAVTTTRPAHAACIARLAPERERMSALAVLSGWVESGAVLVGPALAGVALARGGPAAAIGCCTVALAIAALLVGRPLTGPSARVSIQPVGACPSIRDLTRDHARLVPLVVLVATQYLVIGALDVLLVVLAIGELGLGASGAGYLTAAFGAGGVIGSAAAIWLIGRRRLAGPLSIAALVWGSILALLGVWPTVSGAFLLLAAAGSARSLLDTSGRTLLLRTVPSQVRGQIFGLLEGLSMLALAVGSALVPAFVALGGPRTALIVTGGLLCLVTVVAATAVHGAERSEPSFDGSIVALRTP